MAETLVVPLDCPMRPADSTRIALHGAVIEATDVALSGKNLPAALVRDFACPLVDETPRSIHLPAPALHEAMAHDCA